MNCYGISDYCRPVPEIDKWLRRRIRMCYWKQWRWARTKVRHLFALRTSKRQAHSDQSQELALVEDLGDPDRDDTNGFEAKG